MTHRTATATATLALTLLLAGCSGDGGDDAPSAAATPSQTAAAAAGAEGGAVESTDELLSRLEAAGVVCAEPETGTFPGAAEATSCIVNDSEDVVLLRFVDEDEKQQYLVDKDELSSAVVGENWAIQTVLGPTAEQIQAAIGGELVLGPAS